MKKDRLHPNNIKDFSQPTWFLGTDILDEKGSNDLNLMDQGVGTSLNREEGAIYYCKIIEEEGYEKEFLNLGYSPYFNDLMKEACRRNYDYVWFDRDLETKHKQDP